VSEITHPAVLAWRQRGQLIDHEGHDLFVLDVPASGGERHEPLLLLHGFPSSSFDFRHVLPRLAEHRRVHLLDFLGFGLSAKPDVRYSLRWHADAVETAAAHWGLSTVALLTHDMGDSVGGELLRRSLEGSLAFEVTTRVISNGSVYIDLAHLTDGQQLLLSLPDAALGPAGGEPPAGAAEGFRRGLAGTFAPEHQPDADELEAQWQLCAHNGGHRLLTRTIRYVEDRRAEERRFTGAIESHASPLTIVWGELDPVAVHPMAEKLRAATPGSRLVTLDGVGHYPMLEEPDRFATAVLEGLDPG
jgi:pimeloyl-ACP methyl ester carboxylesterase